jgi:hypothetical protein
MSQIAAGHGHAYEAGRHESFRPGAAPDPAQVTITGGAGLWSLSLLFVGALAIVLTIFGFFSDPRHALASYHVGAVYTLGLALGSLMLLMIMHQFNAGWIVTARRQLENVASLVPLAVLLLVPSVATIFMSPQHSLFTWANPALRDPASEHFDPLLAHKSGFLNVGLFLGLLGFFAVIWTAQARALYRWSLRQDQNGDRWLTARSRFISSFGIVVLALSMAFAAFMLIMSLDYHWFSTMFGVYYFAGSILSAVALLVLILVALRRAGKLVGLVTAEHFHDLGKLLLAFTIFWAYITFSQYFLIWYSNIPEETGWFIVRRQNGWLGVGTALCAFHFGVPFLLLLWRGAKRNMNTIALLALWLLVAHFIDVVYMIRPSVQIAHIPGHEAHGSLHPLSNWWIDLGGWLGPVCLYLGVLARRVARNPLIPLRDPRLHEALHHRNYV